MSSTVGRVVVDVLTNQSGGAVAYGDVVILDTGHDSAFTTTTTGAYTGMLGVCIEPAGIANGASGRIQTQGPCAQVNLNASGTRGHYIKTHTVAKQATDAGTSRVVGAFGQIKVTGSTPPVILFGFPDAASSSAAAGTPALTLSTTNSAGAASTFVATDATVAVFDATAPTTQAFGDAAAAGSAGTAARRDHKHAWPASSTLPGYEIDYVEKTSNSSITATTEATANTIVTGASVAYDGSTIIKVEWYANSVNNPAGVVLRIVLYDGSSVVGELTSQYGAASFYAASYGSRRFTPSNASHTYSVRAWVDASGTGNIIANTGGSGTKPYPCYMRITRV